MLSLDKFHTRQSKMVSPYQTMVRTSVLWMHYLSLDCFQDGLPGKGTAFQTPMQAHSSQQLRYSFVSILGVLQQLPIMHGYKEWNLRMLQKSKSTYYLWVELFHQSEKSSLWLETFQSPTFCLPCSLCPVWIQLQIRFYVETDLI